MVETAHTTGKVVSDAANQSQFFADKQVSGSDQIAPFEKSGVTYRFEPGPALDMPLMIEVIVY